MDNRTEGGAFNAEGGHGIWIQVRKRLLHLGP